MYLYLSNLFEIKNSLWNKETKTKRITHFKVDAQSQVSNCYTHVSKQHDNRKLRQALSRKVTIERNLHAHLNNLKKEINQKDATLKQLANENLLKNTGNLHKIVS